MMIIAATNLTLTRNHWKQYAVVKMCVIVCVSASARSILQLIIDNNQMKPTYLC